MAYLRLWCQRANARRSRIHSSLLETSKGLWQLREELLWTCTVMSAYVKVTFCTAFQKVWENDYCRSTCSESSLCSQVKLWFLAASINMVVCHQLQTDSCWNRLLNVHPYPVIAKPAGNDIIKIVFHRIYNYISVVYTFYSGCIIVAEKSVCVCPFISFFFLPFSTKQIKLYFL